MEDSMQESQQDPLPIARSSNRAEPRVVRSGRRSANNGGGNATQPARLASRPADNGEIAKISGNVGACGRLSRSFSV